MAKTFKPPFAQTPKCASVTLAAANTATDGSGTIATLYTAPAEGAFVKRITWTSAQATAAASSAMVGKIWYSTDGGTTWFIKTEVAIPTATRSTTVIGATNYVDFPSGWTIDGNAKVGVTQSVRAGAQDDMDVMAEVVEY